MQADEAAAGFTFSRSAPFGVSKVPLFEEGAALFPVRPDLRVNETLVAGAEDSAAGALQAEFEHGLDHGRAEAASA